MQDEILAVVEASAPRRWMGVVMLSTVGLLVLYVALTTPPDPGWQVFLIVIGGLAMWQAQRLYQATADRLELTPLQLRSSSGEVIAEVADIETAERGAFAFKPSNGFLIRTRSRGQLAWAPGLWWRFGHRIGIGGVTAAAQTKYMSEILSALIAERG